MKFFTFILSFCGFCIFYICNADWIDGLIENCLGSDYEEIGPFVPSVTAGPEEFDRIVEELRHPRGRWLLPSVVVLTSIIGVLSLSALLQSHFHPFQGSEVVGAAWKYFTNFKKSGTEREEIQTILVDFLEKFKHMCKNKQDEVPVKLLWKGGNLMESSVHCSIKEDSKLQHLQRRLFHSKLMFNSSNGKENQKMLAPSSSETSTARKMTEIRKLLESEQELERFVDGLTETNCRVEVQDGRERQTVISNGNSKKMEDEEKLAEKDANSEWDVGINPKLMSRIRLLESRLRLEELKNKNWINRMARAEDILKKLNKQVEQIEETRPVGTLTGTLKITSTVTNWSQSAHPRRNMRFTLINRCPSLNEQKPYTSLSELIKKEIGLPTPDNWNKNLFQPLSTPQVLALPSPIVMPQSSLLSKFLCR